MEKKKILLIEDEQTLIKALEMIFKREEWELKIAIDGEGGLKMAFEEKPDLILLDIILPKMNGFEVLKQLKRDKKTKDIPVLILSNLGDEEDIRKGLKLGAKDYLIKTDYKIEELTKKVKGLLEKK